MNIKEAMDDLYICATGAKYNTPTLGVGYYEKCWETVLNELDKKDKVIDMMAEQLANYKYEELICMEVDCRHIELQNEGECIGDKNCIKEYFYNKIEK